MDARAWRWVLVVAATVVAFALTIAADRVASLLVPEREGLVFPPDSRFCLKTSEFDFEANVNSLGFRDRPFRPGMGAVPRVVAIGDSFTYGWGVQDSEPWPKALERDLWARGMSVEVANLGRPGAGPRQYLRIAQAAVPVLKPRWVIVGLLQGDDLNQSQFGPPRHEEEPVLRRLYPTLSQISFEHPVVVTAEQTRRRWRRQARRFVTRLKPGERKRYEAMDGKLRARFLRGDLNPSILALSVRTPQYSSWLLNESGHVVRRKIAAMAEQLARIREVAHAHGARVLVVSIPNWPYVSHPRGLQKLGFVLTPQMLSTTAPDDEVRRACRQAGVDRFVDVTEELRRRAADGAKLYFPADGHFTPAGQQAFADALAARLWRILSSNSRA